MYFLVPNHVAAFAEGLRAQFAWKGFAFHVNFLVLAKPIGGFESRFARFARKGFYFRLRMMNSYVYNQTSVATKSFFALIAFIGK